MHFINLLQDEYKIWQVRSVYYQWSCFESRVESCPAFTRGFTRNHAQTRTAVVVTYSTHGARYKRTTGLTSVVKARCASASSRCSSTVADSSPPTRRSAARTGPPVAMLKASEMRNLAYGAPSSLILKRRRRLGTEVSSQLTAIDPRLSCKACTRASRRQREIDRLTTEQRCDANCCCTPYHMYVPEKINVK